MKNLILITFLALTIYSCGDNPVTNNNGNPPPSGNNDSLYFSFDSLVASGTGQQSADTSFLDGRTVNRIKIQYTLETNCTTGDNVFVALRYLNHPNRIIMNLDSLNGNFTLEDSATGTNFANFEVTLFKNTPSNKYLRMKNLKYFKVN